VRLTTGILVLSMRDPVLLAKQVATLDQLSGGRVTLGVAVGGYRDEFESVVPDLRDAPRADLVTEGLEALRVLFDERRSTYHGKYRRSVGRRVVSEACSRRCRSTRAGNVHGSMRRAGRLCEGWLPAKIGPERVRGGRRVVCEYARQAGRDPSKICTALQSVACLGKAADEARQRFERSAFDLFRRSLEKTMTRGVDADAYIETNLIGTPDQVCRKVEAVEQAGVEHLCAILFVANTVYELLDQIRAFAREVIPALPERPRAGRTSSPLTPP